MQLSFQICVGVLAALSTSANGLTFRDRLTQDVNGTTLNVVHGVQGKTDVTFDVKAYNQTRNAWKFNTEGHPDDEAVITPIDNDATLVCHEGSACLLDLDGAEQPTFRLAQIKGSTFSLQDTVSSLYVSRSSNMTLELEPELTEAGHFTLQKITDSE